VKRIVSLLLCFILAFSICQPAFAAVMTWTGSAGDKSWHTAGNWDPAQVPVDGDIVTIPDSSIVEYSSGETSVRLNCAGHLTVSGGTLKLGFGNSILTSGKLDGSGDIVTLAHGELFWNGGSIEGTGNLIVNNGSILTTKASASLDRYLVNNGSLLMTGNLRLTGGAEGIGTFPIQAGQILELSSGSYDLNSLNVNNSGTLRISNTCTFARFNYDFTQQNKGTLEFAIGGPDDFTKLEVAKRATLYGVLKINILDGYVPQAGDTFEIITYSSRTGKFSSIESNVPEITFEPTYSNTGLTLTVIDEKATVWEVANDTDLENALNGFRSGDTIELTSDFTYRKGIVIDGKDITFDTGGFTLNVYNYTEPSPGVGLEVKNGGNVYLIGSGQLYIRQIGGTTSYGVKVTGGSTATVTNVEATGFQNDVAFGVYADGTGSSIQVLGNVHVMAMSGCGAKTGGHGRITVDGTITAMNYINIDSTYKDIASGVLDPDKPGYLKYCNEPETGIVWVKTPSAATPSAPQNFTATPADGQVTLSWTAPDSDGGAEITRYEVFKDGDDDWTDVGLDTSYTFTGLTNGTEYTFKVRAVNSVGYGAETSVTAIPLTVATEPQNFTATPADGQVTLSWTAPESDGGNAITCYEVYKDGDDDWTDVGLDTSYTFTGLTNGTEYTFKVRAVNSAGNGAEASVLAIPRAEQIDECFIATAAFGSKFEPAVVLLRNFRDGYLLSNNIGRALVEFYYQHSPPIAAYISHSDPLKTLVRTLLIPVIAVVYLIMHPGTGIACLILLSLFLVVRGSRNRKNALRI
jgi:hypothetical protein